MRVFHDNYKSWHRQFRNQAVLVASVVFLTPEIIKGQVWENPVISIIGHVVHVDKRCNVNIVCIYVFVCLLFVCRVCVVLYFSVVTSLCHCNLWYI